MLQDERVDRYHAAFRMALLGWQRRMRTAFPAIVQPGGVAADGTITVAPATMGRVRTVSGAEQDQSLPLLIKVPLVCFGGGGFSITAPVATGDEVLCVIADRCIDGWWQSGGVQPQLELRLHDLSDGMAIPGLRSKARALASYASGSLQIRSDDGACVIEMNAGHIVSITAPGGCVINGVTIDASGNVSAPGEVTAGAGTSDSVTLQRHRHGTGTAAAGTSVPTAGT